MTNPLYPAFFRLDRLHLLVVGAGAVGEEKLRFILKSSPNARVTLVAPWMGPELQALLEGYQLEAVGQSASEGARTRSEGESRRMAGRVQHWSQYLAADGHGQFDPAKLRNTELELDGGTRLAFGPAVGGLYLTAAGGHVAWLRREFLPADTDRADLVVAATDIPAVNRAVHTAARAARRLCNIADTPDLCDFYLGSIVTRGPLKVAISTNGQSPTFAKRFRQFLEAELPELETTNLLDNLQAFRDRLTGNFSAKVRELNTLTSGLLASAGETAPPRSCPPGGCLLKATAPAPAPPGTETSPIAIGSNPVKE